MGCDWSILIFSRKWLAQGVGDNWRHSLISPNLFSSRIDRDDAVCRLTQQQQQQAEEPGNSEEIPHPGNGTFVKTQSIFHHVGSLGPLLFAILGIKMSQSFRLFLFFWLVLVMDELVRDSDISRWHWLGDAGTFHSALSVSDRHVTLTWLFLSMTLKQVKQAKEASRIHGKHRNVLVETSTGDRTQQERRSLCACFFGWFVPACIETMTWWAK